MQDTTTQAPVDKAKTSVQLLEASIKALAETKLVSHEDNEAKIKKMLKDAKAKLKELRGPDEVVGQSIGTNCGPDARGAQGPAANAFTEDQQRQVDLATEQFKQSVTRVDNQILAQYIQAIQNGSYAEAEAILVNAAQSQQAKTLTFALLTIGTILLPIYARQRIQNLLTQFGMNTIFANTTQAKNALQEQAEKGAESHVHTIASDIKKSLDREIENQLIDTTVRAGMEERFPQLKGEDQKDYLNDVTRNDDIYKYARALVLQGESRNTIIKKLQENFSDTSKKRADVIAGNESNRVFTLSQFEADEQFLAQNQLTDKAYKRLISNTGHPEAVCKAIIEKTREHPIPFKQDFLPFGKQFVVKTEVDGKQKTLKFTPNYEHLRSGHIHVNCHCRYELLIKKADGTWFNSNTNEVEHG